jgi:hypothetical protein
MSVWRRSEVLVAMEMIDRLICTVAAMDRDLEALQSFCGIVLGLVTHTNLIVINSSSRKQAHMSSITCIHQGHHQT